MALIAEEPPTILPRGYFSDRPLRPASLSVSNIQSERGLPMAKITNWNVKPDPVVVTTGFQDQNTVLRSVDNRFATTQPADPAPTTI
jgi:hypothetical protein